MRLYVPLTMAEYRALSDLAHRERRRINEQAAFLIARALAADVVTVRQTCDDAPERSRRVTRKEDPMTNRDTGSDPSVNRGTTNTGAKAGKGGGGKGEKGGGTLSAEERAVEAQDAAEDKARQAAFRESEKADEAADKQRRAEFAAAEKADEAADRERLRAAKASPDEPTEPPEEPDQTPV